jgi:hypothetical protein
MKLFLFLLIVFSLTFFGCYSRKNQDSNSLKQGISGYVLETKGNQMPMKGAAQKMTKRIRSTVLIYAPTSITDVNQTKSAGIYDSIHTKQIISVDTDSSGHFSIELPIGKYSLFIKMGNQFYANSFDQFNNIALFEVLPGAFTEVKLRINKAASY